MVAGRADLRRFLTDHNVTAVAALPYLDLTLGKDLRHLNIVQQGTVEALNLPEGGACFMIAIPSIPADISEKKVTRK